MMQRCQSKSAILNFSDLPIGIGEYDRLTKKGTSVEPSNDFSRTTLPSLSSTTLLPGMTSCLDPGIKNASEFSGPTTLFSHPGMTAALRDPMGQKEKVSASMSRIRCVPGREGTRALARDVPAAEAMTVNVYEQRE